jgi:predicted metal-dependent peptidase
MEDIEKVVVHLLRNDGVFYARLLTQMRRIARPDLPFAAAVGIKNGYIEMYWNPEKWKELSDIKQRVAILEHECHHLIKNHLNRLGGRQRELWNIAADLAVNQDIQNLPDWVYTTDKYPPDWKMHKGKPAEYYYNVLKQHQKQISFSQNSDGTTKVTIKNSDGSTHGEFDMDAPGNHGKWGDKEGDSQDIAEEVIRQTVKKAVDETQRLKGKVPGKLQDDIDQLFKPPVLPWHRLLRKWVGLRVKASFKYSWKWPNRRFGMTQKGKIPTRKLLITVAIDTSGSVSDADLQAFMVEIQGIMRSYKSKITIIECDAEVQKVYKLTPHTKVDPKFKGRGGTSFVPVFDHIAEKRVETDLLVYFTDLCGTFPDHAPRYPTLWVTIDANMKAPWGDVLVLDRKQQNMD